MDLTNESWDKFKEFTKKIVRTMTAKNDDFKIDVVSFSAYDIDIIKRSNYVGGNKENFYKDINELTFSRYQPIPYLNRALEYGINMLNTKDCNREKAISAKYLFVFYNGLKTNFGKRYLKKLDKNMEDQSILLTIFGLSKSEKDFKILEMMPMELKIKSANFLTDFNGIKPKIGNLNSKNIPLQKLTNQTLQTANQSNIDFLNNSMSVRNTTTLPGNATINKNNTKTLSHGQKISHNENITLKTETASRSPIEQLAATLAKNQTANTTKTSAESSKPKPLTLASAKEELASMLSLFKSANNENATDINLESNKTANLSAVSPKTLSPVAKSSKKIKPGVIKIETIASASTTTLKNTTNKELTPQQLSPKPTSPVFAKLLPKKQHKVTLKDLKNPSPEFRSRYQEMADDDLNPDTGEPLCCDSYEDGLFYRYYNPFPPPCCQKSETPSCCDFYSTKNDEVITTPATTSTTRSSTTYNRSTTTSSSANTTSSTTTISTTPVEYSAPSCCNELPNNFYSYYYYFYPPECCPAYPYQ